MSRRVSAEELEQRYKLKHLMLDFTDSMLSEMRMTLEQKGFSWRTCDEAYLKRKLRKKVKEEDWVAAANYAFMLQDRQSQEETTL